MKTSTSKRSKRLESMCTSTAQPARMAALTSKDGGPSSVDDGDHPVAKAARAGLYIMRAVKHQSMKSVSTRPIAGTTIVPFFAVAKCGAPSVMGSETEDCGLCSRYQAGKYTTWTPTPQS